MQTFPRIPGDFNTLGYAEPNVIPLGEADLASRLGKPPVDGQAVIVYECGEMEAQGILRSTHDATRAVQWEVVIDPDTTRYGNNAEVNTALSVAAASQPSPSSPGSVAWDSVPTSDSGCRQCEVSPTRCEHTNRGVFGRAMRGVGVRAPGTATGDPSIVSPTGKEHNP